MRALTILFSMAILSLGLASCGDNASLPEEAGVGPDPKLPPPQQSVIPTVNIAPAKGWPQGGKPIAASGLQVAAFATGLVHPRWLYVLPNGDVLVAETNAPKDENASPGIKERVMAFVLDQAGAGVPSPNRITLLRDADGDGVAETRSVLLSGLNSPFGMALVGGDLYIADTDALLRFPYREGETEISDNGVKLTDLPARPINYHWAKNVVASPDGKALYVTVGSNSNAGENGVKVEEGRAAILKIDRASGEKAPFATGLRNPNGLAFEPKTGVLWTVVNERDELGGDLVPDFLTGVKADGFYGWPYSYFGAHLDPRVRPQRPDLVAHAVVPDYALGAHSAALGLAFYGATLLPEHYRGGAFIGEHGSWNRKPRSGYKVIYVPFKDGHPDGMAEDILTGFVDQNGDARGRPVGVAVDKAGALLVADDVGNAIWRVTPAASLSAATER